MKKIHPSITPVCAFCEHATPKEPTSQATFSFAFPEEEIAICCPYKKNITYDDTCRHFLFDPLKYKPKAPLPMFSLSKEDVL